MAAPVAIPLYVGYDWSIPVTLTALPVPPATVGAPLDISTWTLAGDLFVPGSPLQPSTSLTAQAVNVSAASFSFFIPKTVTQAIPPQTPDAVTYPTRIMVKYTDASGDTFALRLIFILPLDPRVALL